VLHGGKAFSEARATADVPSPSGPIATLSVPAGAYFISATLSIEPGPGGTGVNTAHCRLLADSTELNYIIEQVSDSNYFESLALNGVHSFPTGGDVRLSCGAYGSVRAKHISLTAVGLSELTYDPPGQTPG
jgi:hypothetical protein